MCLAFISSITTLEAYYAHNFAAAVFVLGGFVLEVHYESLINQYGCVPATIAYGNVQCGKSKATKAALSTVGLKDQKFSIKCPTQRPSNLLVKQQWGWCLMIQKIQNKLPKNCVHFQKAHALPWHTSSRQGQHFLSSMNFKMLRKLSREAR